VATLIAPTPPLQLRRKQTKIFFFFFFLKNMEGAKQMKKIVKKNFWFASLFVPHRAGTHYYEDERKRKSS